VGSDTYGVKQTCLYTRCNMLGVESQVTLAPGCTHARTHPRARAHTPTVDTAEDVCAAIKLRYLLYPHENV